MDPRFGLGIPELVWGFPNRFGDSCNVHPNFDLVIPKPIWGSPNRYGDPQTKMGCSRIDSKMMIVMAQRVTTAMATAQRAMAPQDTTTTTMATGIDKNDDGNSAMGDGGAGNDKEDDCDEQR